MKTVRFPYLSVLLLLTLPLMVSFCSKKTSDPAPQSSHPSTVVSVWAWQKLLVDPPVDSIDDILDFYVQLSLLTAKCLPLFEYEFKANGSIVPLQQTICASTGTGPLQYGPRTGDTWLVNGRKIVITHADGSKDEADLELTDGTLSSGAKSKVMTWKRKIGDQTYTWKFERKL